MPNQQCYDSFSCPWAYVCGPNGLCTRRDSATNIGACSKGDICPAGYACKYVGKKLGSSLGYGCTVDNWALVGTCRNNLKCVAGYKCNNANGYCYCI
jgi:hypothetical protein